MLITGGNVADCTAGATLIDRLPKCDVVNGDKGYDTDALREQIRDRGALANIPPKANRKNKLCFSPFLYRDRNAVDIDQAWRLSRINGGSGPAAFGLWRQAAPGRGRRADRFQRGDGFRVGEHQFIALAAVGVAT